MVAVLCFFVLIGVCSSLRPSAIAQIEQLQRKSLSRSALESKVHPSLRHSPPSFLVPVTISATLSLSIQQRLLSVCQSVKLFPLFNEASALCHLDALVELARMPEVAFVGQQHPFRTSSSPEDARHTTHRRMVLAVGQEGILAHKVDATRSTGAFGKGIKVVCPCVVVGASFFFFFSPFRCFLFFFFFPFFSPSLSRQIGVISDGVDGLDEAYGNGTLSPAFVSILPGRAGSGAEGVAMMELIHAVAPNSTLVFATGIPSLAQLLVFFFVLFCSGYLLFFASLFLFLLLKNKSSSASSVDALVADGCKIIVDDLQFFTESVFQDGQTTPSIVNQGIVIEAFKRASSAGVLCFGAAGNGGHKDSNTSTTYEDVFIDSGTPLSGGALHQFAPGPVVTNTILKNVSSITLQWAAPLGGATADYDFFILDSTGSSVIYSSNFVQNSTQDPIEFFACSPLGTFCLQAGMQVRTKNKKIKIFQILKNQAGRGCSQDWINGC